MTGAVVGRPVELAAIRGELGSAAKGRLAGLTVEGEPGIGKTRLLLAAREIASSDGFTTIAVAADEELRGPFLVARSIFGSAEALEATAGGPSRETLARCLAAMSGQDDPSLASLPPDQKLLRTFDLGAVALRDLAAQRPLALLIDDVQWSDDDSLRLLRYVVRADATSPLFLMFAIRPEELALVNEAVTLIADMERMGMVRRNKLHRFSQVETRELLSQILGGTVDAAGAATVHAQAEGVPFIVEEVAHAYRDAAMMQEIDGVWTLARNAERLMPSAVRTLISRRAAHLPEETKMSLAEAAVLGRHFSLKDLREIKLRVSDGGADPEALAGALAPAVSAGLLIQHPEGAAADYSFAHDQVRDFATAALTPTRRRAIHGAIVELLLSGEPAPESLPLLAHHAKAAGDARVCVRFSIEAAVNALAANAPEEVLRLVDLALPTASAPQDRVALLQSRDQALDMLRRSEDRLQGLAELAALAEALGDPDLEVEVQLRRAAALRLSEEHERAAVLARQVRDQAASRGDHRSELGACLELGQDLLRSPIGEAFDPPRGETDPDGAEEAYLRAVELAEELGDDANLAAGLRELGVIDFARGRDWLVDRVEAGEHMEFLGRVAAGETIEEVIASTPIAVFFERASGRLERALELFERVGDRRGAMSTIIAMGYLHWAPDIHLGSGAGRHIEEIRRLAQRMHAFTKESERGRAEAQMLYGTHVFARAKGVPDLALSRGEDAYRQARLIGDRALEFLAAGGTALAHLDLGEVEPARQWLDRAAAAATDSPTPLRARQLEVWRGLGDSTAGHAEGMRRHLERAVELAAEQGLPAARCEVLARLASEAARLGAEGGDEQLLVLAERSATEAKELAVLLPGHPPWGPQVDAALARVALARGDLQAAGRAAAGAFAALMEGQLEDLFPEILLPIAEVFLAAGEEAQGGMVRDFLRMTVALIAQRTLDEDVRVRWFRGPIGREMTRLAGPMEQLPADGVGGTGAALEGPDAALLGSLVQGRTNREIAEELGIGEDAVTRRLAELFARIGASSRAEATAFAFRARVV